MSRWSTKKLYVPPENRELTKKQKEFIIESLKVLKEHKKQKG